MFDFCSTACYGSKNQELAHPSAEIGMPERTLIFISHANPEDNAFVTWIASRLALAGYDVWADIVQLRGGERFWRDIEDAIRNHAVKVIVVLSNASVVK